jgi:hypothetical protein
MKVEPLLVHEMEVNFHSCRIKLLPTFVPNKGDFSTHNQASQLPHLLHEVEPLLVHEVEGGLVQHGVQAHDVRGLEDVLRGRGPPPVHRLLALALQKVAVR